LSVLLHATLASSATVRQYRRQFFNRWVSRSDSKNGL
jgi:hypothetical protein